MDRESELIELIAFLALPNGNTHSTGVRNFVHLPTAILEVRHKVRVLAATKGGIDKFHIAERGLYQPIDEILVALLPKGAIVDQEAVLKKLENPLLRTDLSIRKLDGLRNARLADHNFAAVIEIKSVFFGESVTEASLLSDLQKLIECEVAYSAKCFFVLIGLDKDLSRVSSSLSKFLLHNAVGPISIELPSGKTAWLHPSARHVVDSPKVYVWTVSNSKAIAAEVSEYQYTVFQAT